MIRKNCQICGKFIWKHPSQIKRGAGKYCSRECSGKANSKRCKTGSKIECDNCGSVFYAPKWQLEKGRKYCSLKCSHDSQSKKVELSCKRCGKNIKRSSCNVSEYNYCSRECYNLDRTNLSKYPETAHLRELIQKQRQMRIHVSKLSDQYVGNLFRQHGFDFNSYKEIPQELIELKRLNIKRKRIIKNHNQK